MSGLPPIRLFLIDRIFIAECFQTIPCDKQSALMAQYSAIYPRSIREANLLLVAAVDAQELIIQRMESVKFPHYSRQRKLKDYGDYHAIECKKLIESEGNQAGFDYCETQEIDKPFVNINATRPEDTNSLESALNRITSGKWWTRKLAIRNARKLELKRIKRGIIGKNKQVYCSDICTDNYVSKQESAKAFFEGMEAVSDDGVVIDMAKIMEGSMSNPEIRRAELMVRVYGCDQYASENDHVAEFITITAPSKYHSNSKKYQGFSPKETQKYLTGLWAKIRAKLKRNHLEVYGIRVVEPHADSCPHWHMMLWMAESSRDAVLAIIKAYALAEDGDEKGADKYRFDHESIKSGTGYATAYLSKYIAKNIDGHKVGIDNETGELSETTSTRVRAWASRWGIRQFQFIGGAPVGVWRELRKVESFDNPLLSQAKEAAENADWKTYLEIQGGALCPRGEQLIRTFNEACIDADTGEIKQSRYGEFLSKVKGLEVDTESVTTRLINWKLQPKNQDSKSTQASDSAVAWLIGNNCTLEGNQVLSEEHATDVFFNEYAQFLNQTPC